MLDYKALSDAFDQKLASFDEAALLAWVKMDNARMQSNQLLAGDIVSVHYETTVVNTFHDYREDINYFDNTSFAIAA